jgi:Cdc6-like AAA superfamily ATPase
VEAMLEMILEEGTEIIRPDTILKTQSMYYKDIYDSKVDSNASTNNVFLDDNVTPTLNNDDMLKCEGNITYDECFNVLNKMSKNKSPGTDGLSCERYLQFWNKIGTLLVNVLNRGLRRGQMSSSQRQAVITLIEKEGKDRCN